MTVRLPLFGPEDMHPAPVPYSDYWEWPTDDGQTKTVTIQNLQPGHTLHAKLQMRAILPLDDGAPLVIAAGDTIIIEPSRSGTWNKSFYVEITDPAVRISFVNFKRLRLYTSSSAFTLEDQTVLPAAPRPADVLALHAYLPVQGVQAFRLGHSRLGVDALGIPRTPREVFTLGRDKLGTRRLDWPESAFEWRDILPHCTRVEARRGVSVAGPVKKAEAGILTLEALDALAPREIGLRQGVPLRLIHWPTRKVFFTGTVTDVEVSPHKPGGRHSYTTRITAADLVARLVGTMRYGARSEAISGQEPWPDRITRLFRSTPDIPFQIYGTQPTTAMAPTVWETNLARHLDAAVGSVGGVWWADLDGGIQILTDEAARGDLGVTFTDNQDTDLDDGIWSYINTDDKWTASQVISGIEAENHSASPDDDGAWRADDVTITVTDEALTNAWTGTVERMPTTLAFLSDLTSLLQGLLRAGRDLPPPSSVTLAPATRYGPEDRARLMRAATDLDIMRAVTVINRSETQSATIATIEHAITPKTWITELTLTP